MLQFLDLSGVRVFAAVTTSALIWLLVRLGFLCLRSGSQQSGALSLAISARHVPTLRIPGSSPRAQAFLQLKRMATEKKP